MNTVRFAALRAFFGSIFFNPYKALKVANADLAEISDDLHYYQGRLVAVRLERDEVRVANKRLRGEVLQGRKEYNLLADTWKGTYREQTVRLEGAEQACEAFMAEREELKGAIKLRDIAGISLCKTAVEQEAVILAVSQDLAAHVQANEALIAERDELAAHVPYLKSVEEVLSAAGVTVQDTPEGPKVTVSVPSLMAAGKAGTAELSAA